MIDWRWLYPFASRHATIDRRRYHYVDEGTGQTLLFVHGNPTWSFYWHPLIGPLRKQFRCIAVDHIGCGLSDKPIDYPYCLTRHIDNLVEFIEQLDLNGVTLVAHDWGGAIGLGAALRLPQRLARIILFNTGAFPPPFIPLRIRACRTPLVGRWAVQGLNAFARAALWMATEKPVRMTPAIKAGLLAPYDSWGSRTAVYKFVEDIPASPRHPTWRVLDEIERGLPSLANRPVQLLWGMRDWCFRPACLQRFEAVFPHAQVERFDDAGHYVVLDAHERIVPAMTAFLVEHPLHAPTRADCTAQGASAPMNDSDRPQLSFPGRAPAPRLSIGQCAALAALLEVTAPKPGNVHRGADFDDATLNDFVASAVAIGPAMENAGRLGVGQTVLQAVQATRAVTATNTNLGAVLLLAPLACVAEDQHLASGVAAVLANLSAQDARDVYRAIRTTQPGGLGTAASMDVAGAPPADLRQAMAAAADRDLVARQYVNGFQQVLREAAPSIVAGVGAGLALPLAIVHAQMELMSRYPDSLIARKCGGEMARRSAALAQRVLDCGPPGGEAYAHALEDLDFWLRGDGRKRNPGTTADLLAAGLFVCLRDGLIGPPFG